MFFKKKTSLSTSIISDIYKKDRFVRYAEFVFGVFLVAVTYNVFILPTNIVYGVGGLGVILKKLFNFDPSITILISSLILLLLSFVLLGKEKTKNSIIGSILYPVFIKLTEWIANYVDFGNANIIVIVVFGAVLTGFGLGFIFKSGFTTGGTDILNYIYSKYFKVSIGKSMIFTDGIIVASSLFVFGLEKFMYSVISLYIISIMTDKVILGISDSKAFFIVTNEDEKIKDFLLKYLSHGVTVINSVGGYTGDKKKTLMCIIPTKEYFVVKEGILNIDKEAFFVVTDAYEVNGGE